MTTRKNACGCGHQFRDAEDYRDHLPCDQGKPLFALWAAFDHDFFGMIIPCKSGVRFTNQVGGLGCHHPEVEGVYVPLNRSWRVISDPLVDHYPAYDRELVQKFIKHTPLRDCLAPIPEPGDYGLYEAWVPVLVTSDKVFNGFSEPVLTPVVGKIVILTYWNSD